MVKNDWGWDPPRHIWLQYDQPEATWCDEEIESGDPKYKLEVDMEHDKALQNGEILARRLGMETDKNGYYETAWGRKNGAGLWHAVKAYISDCEEEVYRATIDDR